MQLVPIRSVCFTWVAYGLLGGLTSTLMLALLFSLTLSETLCVGLLINFTLVSFSLFCHVVQQNPRLIWTPIPWFCLSCGVYFGFGPLIYFFGHSTAQDYSQAVWPVTVHNLFEVTLLNISGTLIVFTTWYLRFTNAATTYPSSPPSSGQMAFKFYAIGMPAKLLTVFSEYGLVNFTLPGVVNWVAYFTSAGLVLLTATAFSKGGVWWILLTLMLGLEISGALITFSKLAIIFSLLPFLFGYLLYRPDVRALRWIPIFLLLAFFASYSFVRFARMQDLVSNAVEDRFALAKGYIASREEDELPEISQNWWIRLNYANVQTFAIQEYDSHNPGNSFAQALIAPIPRFLWPDKPIISDVGIQFYERLTGHVGASFGMGLFAEAYWNGGWLFVILCSIGIGWVFGTVTVLITHQQTIGNLWILPISLLWVRSGGRVDGWFSIEIVGPAVFTVACVALIRVVRRQETRERDTIASE